MKTELPAQDAARTITGLRRFPCPPAKIFAAWADPALLARWWGPAGFSSEFKTFEFRPGGTWDFVMRAPDGTAFPNLSKFVEVAPERIVLDHVVAPVFRMTATLSGAENGGTWLEMAAVFRDEATCRAVRPLAEPSNEQMFDRLEAVLRDG